MRDLGPETRGSRLTPCRPWAIQRRFLADFAGIYGPFELAIPSTVC